MAAALVVAVVYWQYYKSTKEWVFLPFIIITVVVELAANMAIRIFEQPSAGLSNTLILLSNLLLFYWFCTHLKIKRLFFLSTSLVCIAFIVNLYYQSFFYKIYYYPNFLIGLLLLVFVFLYLNKLLNSDKVLIFNKTPALWISIGLLIYQLNLVIIFALRAELAAMEPALFSIVLCAINVIFYSLLSYGLILTKRHE